MCTREADIRDFDRDFEIYRLFIHYDMTTICERDPSPDQWSSRVSRPRYFALCRIGSRRRRYPKSRHRFRAISRKRVPIIDDYHRRIIIGDFETFFWVALIVSSCVRRSRQKQTIRLRSWLAWSADRPARPRSRRRQRRTTSRPRNGSDSRHKN